MEEFNTNEKVKALFESVNGLGNENFTAFIEKYGNK